jgi:hypothetical protein
MSMEAFRPRPARGPVIGLLVVAFILSAAPAEAAFKASTSLSSASGKVRLVVKLTSTKALTARTRPRSVKVKYGKKTYALAKARASASVNAGTWRSAAYTGKAAAALSALAGKSVSVKVTSRAGTASARSAIPTPKSTGGGGGTGTQPGGGGGAQPLFEAPGRQLEGQETAPFLQRYLVNSRFTDCPGAGWPACSVEERYNHCPDGSWEYHRLTPTSGSDINSYASIQVTGARVNPDGSWIVEYTENGYGVTHFYHWEIGTNGRVIGTYDNNTAQPLGPFQYQQPANCGSY